MVDGGYQETNRLAFQMKRLRVAYTSYMTGVDAQELLEIEAHAEEEAKQIEQK